MKNDKLFRWNATGWAAVVFYGICGLLLLIWPDFALSIANYAIAALLCVIGTFMIIHYFRSTPFEAVMGFSLSVGLVSLLMGILLFANSNLLIALLPFVWGVAMIVGGFGKVQMAFDLKRMQDARWWILFIGAAVSFVLGIFSVTRPLFIATIATQFMGVSLLVEAALDAASIIAFRRQIKKAFPQGMGSVK